MAQVVGIPAVCGEEAHRVARRDVLRVSVDKFYASLGQHARGDSVVRVVVQGCHLSQCPTVW